MRAAPQHSLLGWFRRIRPLTDRDPHPSERSIVPQERTDVLFHGVAMRGPPAGHAARCLAGPRQLDALQHLFVPHPAPSSARYSSLGELTFSHHAATGVAANAVNPAASKGAYLRYDVALQVSPCRTIPNCWRSTWCAVTAPLRSQDTTLSACCRSRAFFRGKNVLWLQGDRRFPKRRRRTRSRRPCRGRRRPTFARPAGCLATPHPRCGAPPWPDFGQSGLCGRAFT